MFQKSLEYSFTPVNSRVVKNKLSLTGFVSVLLSYGFDVNRLASFGVVPHVEIYVDLYQLRE